MATKIFKFFVSIVATMLVHAVLINILTNEYSPYHDEVLSVKGFIDGVYYAFITNLILGSVMYILPVLTFYSMVNHFKTHSFLGSGFIGMLTFGFYEIVYIAINIHKFNEYWKGFVVFFVSGAFYGFLYCLLLKIKK